MRIFVTTILFNILLINCTSCQDKAAPTAPSPFSLDKSTLSGVGLQKIDLKNEPEKVFHQKRLVRGDELSVYVVSTQSWVNKIEDYKFDEYIYMLHGESVTRPAEGVGLSLIHI